jgi:CDP-2,3-bis-(O-geranylgeranyl)-sn-glycerol synthase
MHPLVVLQAMALMTVANGIPVVAKTILGARFAWPLDAGLLFFDGHPLLGASKTIRGIVLSIVVTTAAAPLVGLSPAVGALVAATAMAGDLVSSFVKRRLAMKPSSRALGLDQIPESLFPLLACRAALSLTIVDIAFGVALFLVGEIVLSRLLYRIHLRDEPY